MYKIPNRGKGKITECFVLTGVPGTGKTTVANILRKQGYEIISLFEFAQEKNCVLNKDEKRDSWIIDDHKVVFEIEQYLERGISDAIVGFEGHYGDLVPEKFVKKCFVLEAETKDIKSRLEARGYDEEKVSENIEAQIFRECYYDAVEMFGEHRIEVYSSSELSAESISEQIISSLDS